MMNSEKRLDAYKTLTSLANICSGEKGIVKSPFILAASSADNNESKVIVCGEKDEIKELYKSVMAGIIGQLKKKLTADEITQLFARSFSEFAADSCEADGVVESLGLFNFVSMCEETRDEYDEDDCELPFGPMDHGCCGDEYYYEDCPDDGEAVKVIQQPIAEKMTFFEDSLSFGAVEDIDGKVYKLLFSYRSPDGSCIYLRFTDEEVVDGTLTLLTAKYFPDISETTLFPLTEWEDIALGMEYMKQSMGFSGETLEDFLEKDFFDD